MQLILADHGIPVLFGDMLTFSELSIVLGIVIFAETAVLYRCRWGTFSQALLASLLINSVSTLTGAISLLFVPANLNFVDHRRGLIYSYDGFFTLLVLLISYLLSIAIEAGILLIQRSNPNPKVWIISWLANTASYLLVILPLVILFWAAKNP